MNWDAIGAIGNLVSGAGVIITLVFLTLQMRQNTLQMRRQTTHLQRAELNAGMAQFSAWRGSIMANPDLARLWIEGAINPSALSAPDLLRVRMCLSEVLFAMYHVWDREQSGATTPGEAWTGGMERRIANLLSTPFGRDFWAEAKDGFPPAYAAEIERILAAAPPTP